ncbi:MAG: murein biosynthesis integral membrane protein MurJ [Desulfobacteraceae bacterium]|nr:murein biosynthesis integral membrane protein MurJ [Desulfobacteraceae bacterium]
MNDTTHTMKQAAAETGRIARSAGTVGAAVMCSRVTGLVRELVFAFLFGAGFAYDSFVVAFRIPNLLRDLFGEGVLSAAFVTVFSDHQANKGEEATNRLAGNVLVFLALLLGLIVLLGILFAKPLVLLLTDKEFARIPQKVELTSLLTRIMFPFLWLVSLASVVMGMLNTKGRFFIPALASSFFNVGSVVTGVVLAFVLPRFGVEPIIGMAVGTLVGGLLQLAGQLPSLFRTGFAFRPHLDLADPGLRRIIRLMAPAVVGLAALQLNVFINTYFASSLRQGSISWLNYAFRFFQFPVGVFGVAVSVAALPVIARQAAVRDIPRLRETYVSAQTIAFCLTVPATVGLYLLAEPIISLIYEHGRFDHFSMLMTAEALRFYALGLFAYAAVKVMVPVFYALDNTRYPVIGSFIAVVANLAVVLLTIGRLAHRAMALSISCAMLANFLFLSIVLYRQLDGYPLSYLASGLAKVAAAAAAMAAWLLVAVHWLGGWLAGAILWRVAALLLLLATAVALYGGALYLLRLRELTAIIDKVLARVRGERGAEAEA